MYGSVPTGSESKAIYKGVFFIILSEKMLLKNGIELLESDEVFKQVKGWNKYFASNYGRLIHKNNKGKYTIVNPSITKGNYLSYTLSKPARTYKGEKVRNTDGRTRRNAWSITANRLVGLMFVEYDPYKGIYDYSIKYLDIHHKDHNRQNNYFKNLMWLANGKDGTRADHQFINTIQKIAIYNQENAKYHTFKDIEKLCKRIDTDILELIDILKDKDTPSIKDGYWITYKVNHCYIGVQYFKRKER